jgi:hypothetical protein
MKVFLMIVPVDQYAREKEVAVKTADRIESYLGPEAKILVTAGDVDYARLELVGPKKFVSRLRIKRSPAAYAY